MVYTYSQGTFLDHVESLIALFLLPLPCQSWHFPVLSVGEVPNPTPGPLPGHILTCVKGSLLMEMKDISELLPLLILPL